MRNPARHEALQLRTKPPVAACCAVSGHRSSKGGIVGQTGKATASIGTSPQPALNRPLTLRSAIPPQNRTAKPCGSGQNVAKDTIVSALLCSALSAEPQRVRPTRRSTPTSHPLRPVGIMTNSPESSPVALSAALLGLGLLLAVRWIAAPPQFVTADPASGPGRPETAILQTAPPPQN